MLQQDQESLPFIEALKVWLKIAVHSFGGPAGQIAVMHKILVEEKKWISETRFLHALNYCMLLPGPEAQQLATYIGWLLHKMKGGLVAGLLFILPGFVSILILSILYAYFKDMTFVQGIFYGIKPAVLAIVVGAVIKLGKKALKNEAMYAIAIIAFLAIFLFKIDFPYIVLGAGIAGFLGGKFSPKVFNVMRGHQSSLNEDEHTDRFLQKVAPSWSGFKKTVLIFLGLWMLPFAVIIALGGSDGIFMKEASFFSKAAVVTFGGAYSVLAYIAQKAVESYGWLNPGEMLDGLGMAETTPGPLIQVVQFVGFMGAFRYATDLSPLVAGVVGSVLVTWVTFVPCFLFIFAGAPFIEYLRGNANLTSALSGITAAVVGVVLNLGVWFSINTLFSETKTTDNNVIQFDIPVWQTLDLGAFSITIAAFLIYFWWKAGMIKTILLCIGMGLIFQFLIR